jgi:hypothetical protein
MPPSSLFTLFDKTNCSLLEASTTLRVSRPIIAKLRKSSGQKTEELWFGKAFEGEGKLKIGFSILMRVREKKGEYGISFRWFITNQNPPEHFGPAETFMDVLADRFGEREVDIFAEFQYDKGHTASLFKPFDLGEQSQILDEIVGFSGVKRDPMGKILYRMDIAVTNKVIQHKLSFRQTVRLLDDMIIPLVETASKISALAIKAKEAQ